MSFEVFFGKILRQVENGQGIMPKDGDKMLCWRLLLKRIQLFRLVGGRRFNWLIHGVINFEDVKSFMSCLVFFVK